MDQTAEALMLEYGRATNSHDLQATLAMVDDGAIYFFSNESVHVGKEEIASALRRNFESIQDEQYSIANLTWLVNTEQVAVCIYDYAWSGMIGGEPASGSGRGTTVMRRRQDGWKVVHEHLSRGRFAVSS